MERTPLNIVWFKRDLRTTDHAALSAAAEHGPVLPLFIVEPELWKQPDMSGRHWAFVRESLAQLQDELGALGQSLVIRVGDCVGVLDVLRRHKGIAALWSHQETGNDWTYKRDLRVKAYCKDHSIIWNEPRQSGVIRRIDTRNGWARRWDRFMAQPVVPAPALQPLGDISPGRLPVASDLDLAPDPCPGRQPGGRAAGLETLSSFLHQRGEDYRAGMSSPLSGFEVCSRLSPHLAWGTLSLRETAQATWARQRGLKAHPKQARGQWSGALSSFSGRLHWRDHFTQKLEDEPSMEWRNLHRAYDGLRPQQPDGDLFQAWQAGETGLPFVDACMRALHATGWMNFRMRAMLVAVSSYHLWLHWRLPGEHLARLFTDYEPGIHWPQMQMQSGTTGINTVRVYNPVKQGFDQDASGDFVRKWVPELAQIPGPLVHEPWRWEGASSLLGKVYPYPVVDHLAAAKAARLKVWSLRGGASYRQAADAIQDKHGSRKSGLPRQGQKAKRTDMDGPEQLSLPLTFDQTEAGSSGT